MNQPSETERQRVQARIADRIDVTDCGYESPCWISNRTTMGNGYTRMFHEGKVWLTHRLAFEDVLRSDPRWSRYRPPV